MGRKLHTEQYIYDGWKNRPKTVSFPFSAFISNLSCKLMKRFVLVLQLLIQTDELQMYGLIRIFFFVDIIAFAFEA